jgi:hypothetical protein
MEVERNGLSRLVRNRMFATMTLSVPLLGYPVGTVAEFFFNRPSMPDWYSGGVKKWLQLGRDDKVAKFGTACRCVRVVEDAASHPVDRVPG